ncbi:MAG: hypothetical protein NVS1B9_07560 [Solirubrobacteraceae bacterium]
MQGPPVHGERVVLNQAGTAFETVTMDSGAFKSLSGNTLTITEAVGAVVYKDATLTIPANATVVRNGAKTTLAALAAGDRVRVAQSPEATFVLAADAAHQRRGPFGEGRRHLGRGDKRPPFGPPPGPPPAF